MALEHPPAPLSYSDYLRLPSETPGEVIEGELVVGPSPFARHQDIALSIAYALRTYLMANPEVGRAYVAPLDVVLRAASPAIVVQPDVLFVSASRGDIVQEVIHGAPDLVVEVVSPGSARMDAVRKRALYARFGVSEYWLVWPVEERVDVFRPGESGAYADPSSLTLEQVLTSPQLPAFELPVAHIFSWGR